MNWIKNTIVSVYNTNVRNTTIEDITIIKDNTNVENITIVKNKTTKAKKAQKVKSTKPQPNEYDTNKYLANFSFNTNYTNQ
jgi:hypothetical protein